MSCSGKVIQSGFLARFLSGVRGVAQEGDTEDIAPGGLVLFPHIPPDKITVAGMMVKFAESFRIHDAVCGPNGKR